MGEWTRLENEWLKVPRERISKWGSFQDRGADLISLWIKASTGDAPVHLTINVGFEMDAKADTIRGGMISIHINNASPLDFRLPEVQHLVSFLREAYRDSDNPLAKDPDHLEDMNGFVHALEVAIDEAEKLMDTSTRN